MSDIAYTLERPAAPYDVERIRADFPILSRTVHERTGKKPQPGKPLVYLDSGASAQKPRHVIDTMTRFLEEDYSNIHRGVHFLSQRATDRFEAARDSVAAFLNAPSRDGIVFTRSATEAINLVAHSYARTFLEPGDEIIVSVMEHHANIVPWQLAQTARGLAIKVVPVDDRGVLDLDAYAKLFGPRTKMVAITHCSNVLGTVTPAKEIVRIAHQHGVPVLLDGSQAVVHGTVDVKDIGADFYVFTGHKLYGPTGIGVLCAKPELLKTMPPYQGGGDMIQSVSFSGTTFKEAPARFEAGTPPITEAIGLAAAIDYVEGIGRDAIAAHEHDLLTYATARLQEIEGLRIVGTAPGKAAIISFVVDGVHPHDLGTVVDQYGVAVRVGQHCAEPLMDRMGVGSTARASFALYNTRAEADALVDAVKAVKEFFGA
ncbi:cysteine desulfurase [Azospirillum sp. TSO22-1]|uniref:cysteine desulfurase n=1 Tax=Azospirillum sp. TSO22-1 TaxID=716789 RepID=UPI000D611D6C|nr:cysteine desulfurase [Azospirillum sp. TSO22-1]PWC44784.1 cysteine desulfurase [Azospirillum sp. TSO22-1]